MKTLLEQVQEKYGVQVEKEEDGSTLIIAETAEEANEVWEFLEPEPENTKMVVMSREVAERMKKLDDRVDDLGREVDRNNFISGK